MPDPTDDTWVLVFRPLPSDVPVPVRIRRLLKIAGRQLALRCVLVRDPTPDELAHTGGDNDRIDAALPAAAD